MRAAEVMSTDVLTVKPETAATDAWELMRRKRIHHLVVMTDSTVVGILSDRDAGGRSGGELRARSSVTDLMTASAVTVDASVPIRKMANLMRGRTIGCLPVVDGKKLVGIVTVSDLLEVLGGGADRPSKPRRRPPLHTRVPHRKDKRRGGYGVW